MSTISKQECLSLLFELKENGVDTSAQIKSLLLQKSPSIEIIKFINDHRELDIRKFYEKLRHSYNNKHSKLYGNIVRCNEIDGDELICCAGALLQKILLFNKKVESIDFLKQARFNELLSCMKHFYETRDLVQVRKLLNYVKADLKVLEEISTK